MSGASQVYQRPPGDAGPFAERTHELELIHQFLLRGTSRLLTLTGPAGVGKTRLALEASKRFASVFPNSVRFIDLTAVCHEGEVASVLEAMQFPHAGTNSESSRRPDDDGESLLILDNFEHVLRAAPLLEPLLTRNPKLRVLVTSREVLRLRVEQTLVVPPLSLPDLDYLQPVDRLAVVPSVWLFIQRARLLDPDFDLDELNARTVAELCVRLDGLPLAIELAAARIRVLSPRMVLERLERQPSILRWEALDLPPRQRTLGAAIAWSYELLSRDEQAFLRRLGIFVGGFTVEAAEAVLSHDSDRTIDALEGLSSLVEKSLVQSADDGNGALRFRLLESVREFVARQWTDELESLAEGHARFFVELAERAAPELVGSAQREWYMRLELERGNLLAALRWLWAHQDVESALRLVAALGQFWEVRGYLLEGTWALQQTLSLAPRTESPLRASVLIRLGSILLSRGDAAKSRPVLEQALAIGRALHDADLTARALGQLGRWAELQSQSVDELRQGSRLLEQALALRQHLPDQLETAYIETRLAWIALSLGEYAAVARWAAAALARYEEAGDAAAATVPLLVLALAEAKRGDALAACARMRRSLDTVYRLQDRRLLLLQTNTILWSLAGTHADNERMATILGVTEALEDTSRSRSPAPQREWTLDATNRLQTCLGNERFARARNAGRRLRFSEICDLTGALLDDLDQARSGPIASIRSTLTNREQQVLHLLAEGLTNKEIAKRLVLTENTVKTHVTSVFNKLGVESRARAVAVAAHTELLDGVVR